MTVLSLHHFQTSVCIFTCAVEPALQGNLSALNERLHIFVICGKQRFEEFVCLEGVSHRSLRLYRSLHHLTISEQHFAAVEIVLIVRCSHDSLQAYFLTATNLMRNTLKTPQNWNVMQMISDQNAEFCTLKK